ncbi:PaaI family thioesterase [Sphingobium sp. AN558]|uniref:PaaI family thioesterase n=1 Tax=Sphingobium sp. AN558 TaxID=3133442 RepID=UPI0030C435F9
MADTFLALLGPVYSRPDGERRAIVELEPRPEHRNRAGALHGGFIAGFADHALFSGLVAMGHEAMTDSVTVDLSIQYMAAGSFGEPLRAEVELIAETGRLLFMRMTLVQAGRPVAAAAGTLRKPSRAR